MAKKRPSLGTFASPTQTFVAPVQAEKTIAPLDQQAIRETYAFADAFGELSQSMVKVASAIKTDMNAEAYQSGQEKINSSRRTYAQLVQSGDINPSENPWMAIGAQKASGVLEASRARNEFKIEYDKAIANNPDLLKDNSFFDALASSYASNKSAEFGTAPTLSQSFFDSFNQTMVAMSAEHAQNVGKYRQGKIMESIKVKVYDAMNALSEAKRQYSEFGPREDGTSKDLGYYGVMYDAQGNAVTEKSITVTTDDGIDIDLPLLVPGLSLEGREAIVYAKPDASAKEIMDSLKSSDIAAIFDHAAKRRAQGKSPFYSTTMDKILPEVQAYMDEQGQNMGLQRVANLATAAQLIEVMKSSSLTFEAEDVLNGLMAGTGKLSEVSEVKSMLADAQADIAKNRAEIQAARMRSVVASRVEEAFQLARSSAGEGNEWAGVGAFFDEFEGEMNSLGFSSEMKNKATEQAIEAINRGTKFGSENLDYNQRARFRRQLAEDINEMAKKSRDPIIDMQGLLRKAHDRMRQAGIQENSPEWTNGIKDLAPVLTEMLNRQRAQIDAAMNDASIPREVKQRMHTMYRINEINAAVAFGLESRIQDLRSIAMNGISVDVERGLRPELIDLIEIHANFGGGRGPLEQVFAPDSPAGKRMIEFLDQVQMERMGNKSLPDAVRDVAQRMNMMDKLDALSLTNLSKNGATQAALRDSAQKAIDDIEDQSYMPFGFGSIHMNPDSKTYARASFMRQFVSSMDRTSGGVTESLEKAREWVSENHFLVRGSIIPKNVFPKEVDKQYIEDFIAWKMGGAKNGKDITLVVVGDAPNGQPIFALRDSQGNAVRDEYYNIDDISGKARPRNEFGELIPNGKSPHEMVTEQATIRQGHINIRQKMLDSQRRFDPNTGTYE